MTASYRSGIIRSAVASLGFCPKFNFFNFVFVFSFNSISIFIRVNRFLTDSSEFPLASAPCPIPHPHPHPHLTSLESQVSCVSNTLTAPYSATSCHHRRLRRHHHQQQISNSNPQSSWFIRLAQCCGGLDSAARIIQLAPHRRAYIAATDDRFRFHHSRLLLSQLDLSVSFLLPLRRSSSRAAEQIYPCGVLRFRYF